MSILTVKKIPQTTLLTVGLATMTTMGGMIYAAFIGFFDIGSSVGITIDSEENAHYIASTALFEHFVAHNLPLDLESIPPIAGPIIASLTLGATGFGIANGWGYFLYSVSPSSPADFMTLIRTVLSLPHAIPELGASILATYEGLILSRILINEPRGTLKNRLFYRTPIVTVSVIFLAVLAAWLESNYIMGLRMRVLAAP